MKKPTFYQTMTILVTLITITVNGLANALPLNGQGTGEISDRFDIFFVPAGYVFSIWGLIYLGLIAFTIYQGLSSQKDNILIKKISPAYWVGSLANVIWIFLWHYEIFSLTLVAMMSLLLSLLFIFVQIKKEAQQGMDTKEKWLIIIPFSIYLGWISVATIANVSQVLFFFDWNGWGISAITWTIIMSAIAVCLGLLMQWRENAASYALVLIWAFIGIAISQADSAIISKTAWIASGVLGVSVLAIPLIKRNFQQLV